MRLLTLTPAEIEALNRVFDVLLPFVNHGCDAWLFNGKATPHDDTLLLDYDEPAVDVLNSLHERLKSK